MTFTVVNPFITGLPFPASLANCKVFLHAGIRGTVAERWDDLSGSNNHFTSPAAANFPSFVGGEATFDGSTKHLLAPLNMMAGATAGEIFIRQKRYADNGDAATNSGWMHFGTDPSNFQDHFTYSSTIYCGFGSNGRKTCGNPTPATNTYHTINIWSASADWSLSMGSTVVYSTASNTVAWASQARLGASYALGTYFQGTIKAMALFSRKLTAFERADVLAYMETL